MPQRAIINNESFYAWDLSEDNRGQSFKCPICNDDMIVVLPRKKIKHFRHWNLQEHGGEPETERHLEMKYYFYNEATKIGYKADIEVRFEFKDKIHIADVVIEYPHQNKYKGIVIECQHSSITQNDINSRNLVYFASGYRPIWVYDHDTFLNKTYTYYRNQILDNYEEIKLFDLLDKETRQIKKKFMIKYPQNWDIIYKSYVEIWRKIPRYKVKHVEVKPRRTIANLTRLERKIVTSPSISKYMYNRKNKLPILRIDKLGKIYVKGIFIGEKIDIMGMTPKYAVDCKEFFEKTFFKGGNFVK